MSPPDKDYQSWASFNPPIGLEQKRATAQATEIIMKQPLSMSGGDFEFLDDSGKTIYTCKGKFKMNAAKDMYDEHGDLLLHFETDIKSLHRKTIITDITGQEVFYMRKIKEDWPNLSVEFIDEATEKPMVWKLDGEYFKDRGMIKMDNQPVAQVWRESMFKLRRNIIVAPGVDVALVAGICIVFDVIQQEHYANWGLAVPHKKS